MDRGPSPSRVAWKSAALSIAASLLILLIPGAAAEEAVEIEIAGCQPNDVDLDAQGRPWFTCSKSNQVGMIDPETKRPALYDAKPGCGPFMGAFDAQGRYWFTERDCGKIAVLDPAAGGSITEYPVGINSTQPQGIAVDGSGKILVALLVGGPSEPDGVGRFDPSTKTWEYAMLAHSGTKLIDITVRKSGELVVCDFQAGGVYRVDIAAKKLTKFAIPTVLEPTWCREAPDGRLWITSHGPNTQITVVSAGDTYANYSYPQVGLLPYAIDFDNAGNAWFTEHLGNHIHRVTPKGPEAEFGPRIPIKSTQSLPFSMAIDQKNCNAWVGENKENKIAFFPGSMLCPKAASPFPDLWISIIVLIVGVAAMALGVVVLKKKKKREAEMPKEKTEQTKEKKDAL